MKGLNSLGLIESQELLELAQEAGRLGLFEWQVPTGTVRLSPKFLSLYGLTDFDGRYDSWFACVSPEDQTRVAHQLEQAFGDGARELQTDFRIVSPLDRGVRWIESRFLIFYDPHGRPVQVVGVNVDVTERKRALVELRAFTDTLEEAVRERTRELVVENEARRKAEESLRQAQKMEAVGQLTGGVAHDFNNLLTIILGGLDVVGRHLGSMEPSPAKERIQRARDMAVDGARRAATLTSRLLAFSRQQVLSPDSVDANKLVAAFSEFLRRTIGETVALETVLAGGLWRTFVDPLQLENALLNLAVNARDAMPSGGKLTVETANAFLDEAYVAGLPEPVEPGQYVMISVADTGSGMDHATLERAFDPFFTTKEIGKGTGLGLSQVYGFVRQSAGHVRIYSEPGQGTTVKIYLRRHFGPQQQAETSSAQAGEAPRSLGGETILVVEDDHSVRAYTVEMLRELGYRVLQAVDGPSALAMLAREGHIDLLLTDVIMPGGMNGRQLAEEAERARPGLPILFTTGYSRNAIIHHGRVDPGVQLISKPFGRDQLAAKLRELLDR